MLEEFLREEELRALEEKTPKVNKQPDSKPNKSYAAAPPTKMALRTQPTNVRKVQCPICHNNHNVFLCTEFKSLSVKDRYDKVKMAGLCFNCMSTAHATSQCLSTKRCQRCSKRHHTLLHAEDGSTNQRSKDSRETSPNASATAESVASAVVNTVSHHCLSLTFITLASSGHNRIRCRDQQDTVATLSLVTKKLANQMQAKRLPRSSIQISGVGGEIVSPYQIEMKLTSTQNDQYVTIRASVIDAIPPYSVSASMKDVKAILSFRTLNLADRDYTSGDPVDVLLSNTHSNWTMMDGAVLSPDKCYRAQNTIFGWIVGGDGGVEPPTATCLRLTAVQETPEKLMKTIWELDQAPYYEEFNSLEDLQAKEDFQDSHSRLPSGRYVVTLPRRKPAVELGESRSLAMKRFHQNEKTLLRRNQLAAYT